MNNVDTKKIVQRLLLSRMRILNEFGFYGMLLMNISFAIDLNCKTSSTDGDKIYFNPEYVNSITNEMLDFILMHNITHVVLQHPYRRKNYNDDKYDVACDIVVNSHIIKAFRDKGKINLEAEPEYLNLLNEPHLAPNGEEGYNFTVEEIYEMLKDAKVKLECSKDKINGEHNIKTNIDNKRNGSKVVNSKNKTGFNNSNERDFEKSTKIDEHNKWQGNCCGELAQLEEQNESLIKAKWDKNLINAINHMKNREMYGNNAGKIPAFAERRLKELKEGKLNWKELLNNFIQEEINDYSFLPPDKRFAEFDFFIPDFNEKDLKVSKILFMVDTSGSMSEIDITECYSEIKWAIEQFNGKLEGWLGFFDAEIKPPEPFVDEDEFTIIKAYGGGGTNFKCIFNYINQYMENEIINCIIILTDGIADYPQEMLAKGIPVLWLINNNYITPPWGRVVRLRR